MSRFKSKLKLMWNFLSERLQSGAYGNRFFAVKRDETSYIIAVKVMNQRKLSNAKLNKRDEWALLLEYCQLKGRAAPKTEKEFTSVRSTFFSAILKCRCIPDGNFRKITYKKDFERHQIEPSPDYKYFLFTCSNPRFMPDWPVKYFENCPNSPQVVPRTPDVLEMAMDEAELDTDDPPHQMELAGLKSEPMTEDRYDNRFEDIENMLPVEFLLANKRETPLNPLGYCSNHPPPSNREIVLDVTKISLEVRLNLFQNLRCQLANTHPMSPDAKDIIKGLEILNGASEDVYGAASPDFNRAHDFNGVAASPDFNGAHDFNGVAASPDFNRAHDFNGVAASPDFNRAHDFNGVAASPDFNRAQDFDGVAVSPDFNGAQDFDGVVVSPDFNGAQDFDGVAVSPDFNGVAASPDLDGVAASPDLDGVAASPDLDGVAASPDLDGVAASPDLDGVAASPDLDGVAASPDLDGVAASPDLDGVAASPDLDGVAASPDLDGVAASPDFDRALLELFEHFHEYDGALAVMQDNGPIPPVASCAQQNPPGDGGVTLRHQVEQVDHSSLYDLTFKQLSSSGTLNTPPDMKLNQFKSLVSDDPMKSITCNMSPSMHWNPDDCLNRMDESHPSPQATEENPRSEHITQFNDELDFECFMDLNFLCGI